MTDRNAPSQKADKATAPNIQGGDRNLKHSNTGVRQPMAAPGGPISEGGAQGGVGGQPDDPAGKGGMIGEG